MRVLRINRGKTISFFPRLVIVSIVIVVIIQVPSYLSQPWSLIVIILLCIVPPAIWFATNVLIIDVEKKFLFDGVWVMGFKLGQVSFFESINKIEIRKEAIKKTLFTLPGNKQLLAEHEFRAYVYVTPEGRHYLLSHPLEETIQKKVTQMKQKLSLEHRQ